MKHGSTSTSSVADRRAARRPKADFCEAEAAARRQREAQHAGEGKITPVDVRESVMVRVIDIVVLRRGA